MTDAIDEITDLVILTKVAKWSCIHILNWININTWSLLEDHPLPRLPSLVNICHYMRQLPCKQIHRLIISPVLSLRCAGNQVATLTLHLMSRYGWIVVQWLTSKDGFTLQNKYSVEKQDTSRELEPRPSTAFIHTHTYTWSHNFIPSILTIHISLHYRRNTVKPIIFAALNFDGSVY